MGTQSNDNSLETKVTEILSKVVTEDGKLDFSKLDSDISDEMKLAVTNAKRYRDTQSSFTKTRQELKKLEAEKTTLENMVKDKLISLPDEVKEELDYLKQFDPDSYIEKLQNYKEEYQREASETLQRTLEEASKKAINEFTKEQRESLLNMYNKSNPDYPITEEQLRREVPVSLIEQMDNGSITFDEVIEKARKFIYGNVQVSNPTVTEQPSLGAVGASGGAGKTAPSKSNEDFIW